MEAILNSFLLVAAAEMGDKTQLLAFILASRFGKPWVIFSGIFVATIFNHLLASAVGTWVSHVIPGNYIKWILASIFIVFAAWILLPDKEEGPESGSLFGAFMTTVITFFLAEMGDKTQLATVALAAKYQNVVLVTIGTTLGMLFSDGLAVFIGDKLIKKVSMRTVRIIASALFVIFGIAILIGY